MVWSECQNIIIKNPAKRYRRTS